MRCSPVPPAVSCTQPTQHTTCHHPILRTATYFLHFGLLNLCVSECINFFFSFLELIWNHSVGSINCSFNMLCWGSRVFLGLDLIPYIWEFKPNGAPPGSVTPQESKTERLYDKTSTGSWLIELPQIASHGAASLSSLRPGSIIAWFFTVTFLTSCLNQAAD